VYDATHVEKKIEIQYHNGGLSSWTALLEQQTSVGGDIMVFQKT
jgi:hypothetical protein